jgi:ankyrin repeat protein
LFIKFLSTEVLLLRIIYFFISVEDAGLSVGELTPSGQTALHVAAREGQDSTLQYLIQRRVSLDIR